MEPQEIVSRRRKRQAAGVEEACLGNGIERVLFALAPNNDFLQVEVNISQKSNLQQEWIYIYIIILLQREDRQMLSNFLYISKR